MDSQAPNKVACEWLKTQGWDYIKPECKFGNSRLDFYMERTSRRFDDNSGIFEGVVRAFMEVKVLAYDCIAEPGMVRMDKPVELGL